MRNIIISELLYINKSSNCQNFHFIFKIAYMVGGFCNQPVKLHYQGDSNYQMEKKKGNELGLLQEANKRTFKANFK